MIKEVIVVEGRDDLRAVKEAVDAEVITTGGFALGREVIERIKLAQKRKGVIIFTDPDYAGEMIRRKIKQKVSGCKDAYLSQVDAVKNKDIGIENASPEIIKEALRKAKAEQESANKKFTKQDLIQLGLLGVSKAKERRELIGKELGIGYANGKQFLSRLNNYQISPEELIEAVEKISRGGKN